MFVVQIQGLKRLVYLMKLKQKKKRPSQSITKPLTEKLKIAKHKTGAALFDEEIIIKTMKKQIVPYSNHQKMYLKELFSKEMVFATGPAGTGKTYLAVAVAVSMMLNHKVERIVLVRPAVEAGEGHGRRDGPRAPPGLAARLLAAVHPRPARRHHRRSLAARQQPPAPALRPCRGR